MQITLKEYFECVHTALRENPHWRYGQALFNVLHEFDPELAHEIAGTEADPFFSGCHQHRAFWDAVTPHFKPED